VAFLVVVYLALQIRQTQQFMRAQVERPIMRISVDGGKGTNWTCEGEILTTFSCGPNARASVRCC
jgi:hypothetical protein